MSLGTLICEGLHLNCNDLHHLTEAFCVRLHIFQPQLPGIPSLGCQSCDGHEKFNNTDHSTLDPYCKMFELDEAINGYKQRRIIAYLIYLHTRVYFRNFTSYVTANACKSTNS
jgi:hypothetical protein